MRDSNGNPIIDTPGGRMVVTSFTRIAAFDGAGPNDIATAARHSGRVAAIRLVAMTGNRWKLEEINSFGRDLFIELWDLCTELAVQSFRYMDHCGDKNANNLRIDNCRWPLESPFSHEMETLARRIANKLRHAEEVKFEIDTTYRGLPEGECVVTCARVLDVGKKNTKEEIYFCPNAWASWFLSYTTTQEKEC